MHNTILNKSVMIWNKEKDTDSERSQYSTQFEIIRMPQTRIFFLVSDML